jgi:integrase/recombinase XerD
MTPLAPHIQAFLRDNLSRHRGASQHTCDSYACSFRLLFEFAAARLRTKPSALSLEQINSEVVSAFLEDLEDRRQNAPETRNVRLAAIKSFFRFLEHRHPAALEQLRRVLAIPFKKTSTLWSLISSERRSKLCWMRLIRRRAMVSGIERCCIWRFAPAYVYPS